MTFNPTLLRLTAAVALALATLSTANAQDYRLTVPVKALKVTPSATTPTTPGGPVAPGSPTQPTTPTQPTNPSQPTQPAPEPVKAVTLSTASLAFSDTLVDQTSTAGAVGVMNTGEALVSLGVPSITGPFLATTDCTNSLAVGGQCVVNVSFKPHTYGTLQGYMTMSTGAGQKQVNLTGTGLGAYFQLRAGLPSSMTFEPTYVGAQAPSDLKAVAWNRGNISGTMTAPTLSGESPQDFTLSSACNSVASEQECTTTVTFTPKNEGARRATLNVLGSTVSLSGNAAPAPTKGVNFAGMINGAKILNPANVAYYGPSPYNATVDNTCSGSWQVTGILCANNTVGTQSYGQSVATTWRNTKGTAYYVVIDMGQTRQFNTAYVYQPNSDGRFTQVQLAVSDSPLPYADAGWTVASAEATFADNVYTPQRMSFAPASGRYVRVQLRHNGTTSSSYVEIRGLQLFYE